MQIITHTNPKMIIADEGKHIRDINDIYVEKHVDFNGDVIEEHFPYYTEVIFIPENANIDEIIKLYVEEDK